LIQPIRLGIRGVDGNSIAPQPDRAAANAVTINENGVRPRMGNGAWRVADNGAQGVDMIRRF
jgi:hypothetical protein